MAEPPRCPICGSEFQPDETNPSYCRNCGARERTVRDEKPFERTQSFRDDDVVPLPPGLPDIAIPGYRILGVLGKGGMGVVFKAEQEKANNRLVAIKMILAHRGFDAEQDKRFETEVNAISAIEHPNIVRVYEVGEANGQRYFTMEYCTGGTLYERLKDQLMLPLEAAGTIAVLTRAMAAVHAKNIIHRDLKPLNVLYDAHGTPKVTDFGLAKNIEADDGGTATGAVLGTLGYMSPEQASGKGNKATPETDVYALGAILYSCLTGRVPLAGSTVPDTLNQIQNTDPVPVRRLVPNAPRDLETICEKCLQKDPTRRYRTAAELAEDLQRYLDGRPIAARPVSRVEKLWKAARRRPTAAALIATLVASGIGAVVASVLLYLANERERGLRLLADDNALRADVAAKRAQRFSGYILGSLGEADFWSRYIPLYVIEEGKTEGAAAGIRVSPDYLRKLRSLATTELADQPHERAKILATLSSAFRTQAHFEDSAATLDEAERAFASAPETTPEDRERLRFSRACHLHEVGEFEPAYRAFAEILDSPTTILSETEVADTRLRIGWLCAHRRAVRRQIDDDTGKAIAVRARAELQKALAFYKLDKTPLAKVKRSIVEILLVLEQGKLDSKTMADLLFKLPDLPNSDQIIQAAVLYVEAERLRREGKFVESIAKFRELEQLALRKFGRDGFFHIIALAALAGGENTAFERSPDTAFRQKCQRDATEHTRECIRSAEILAPRHPFLAEGHVVLAQLLIAQKQLPEARESLRKAREIARFHPVDLKPLTDRIDAIAGGLPKE
jgi:tetratricopeptide (TPR) repeat protein